MTWKDGNIYKGTWNDTEEGLQGKGIMLSLRGKRSRKMDKRLMEKTLFL